MRGYFNGLPDHSGKCSHVTINDVVFDVGFGVRGKLDRASRQRIPIHIDGIPCIVQYGDGKTLQQRMYDNPVTHWPDDEDPKVLTGIPSWSGRCGSVTWCGVYTNDTNVIHSYTNHLSEGDDRTLVNIDGVFCLVNGMDARRLSQRMAMYWKPQTAQDRQDAHDKALPLAGCKHTGGDTFAMPDFGDRRVQDHIIKMFTKFVRSGGLK